MEILIKILNSYKKAHRLCFYCRKKNIIKLQYNIRIRKFQEKCKELREYRKLFLALNEHNKNCVVNDTFRYKISFKRAQKEKNCFNNFFVHSFGIFLYCNIYR